MTPLYVARHPMTAARELGGEMIVISAGDSRLFTLNEAGAAIWKAADGATTLDDIVSGAICSDYEVDAEEARADTEAFVRELAQHGVLVLSDRPIDGAAGANGS